MATTTYDVAGMHCGSCANKISNEVAQVPGVTQADVDLAQGKLNVSGEADDQAIRSAVTELGYQITPA